MKCEVIGTGSKGNAVLVGERILIDCGVPFAALREIEPKIQLVLLTHEHGDHFRASTIRALAQLRPGLRFGCCAYLARRLIACGVNPKNVDVFDAGVRYDYGAFAVMPVKLCHDVPNCGYRLYFGEKRAFYATDTATLDNISAEGYDLYMVEANYIMAQILDSINEKAKHGEYAYERRVLATHLSREDCDAFLEKNAGAHSRVVYLHRHEDRSEVCDDNVREDSFV